MTLPSDIVVDTPSRLPRGSVPAVPLASVTASESAAQPAAQGSARRGQSGILVGLGLVALKLLKGAKVVKLLLFGAFIWSLALNHPLPFALALAYAVLVHESGHLLAMKHCGLPTSGMWFIPFLGAAAVAKQGFRSYGEEFYIAIAGPVFGLLSLVPLFAAAILLPRPYAAQCLGYASLAGLVNLFNLLPIGILDGGRIIKCLSSSLSRVLGVLVVGGGLLLCAILMAWVGGAVLGVILGISIAELLRARKRQPLAPMSRGAVIAGTAAYVALFAAIAIATFSGTYLAHDMRVF